MEKMYKQMPVQVHADCCGASKGADLSGIVPLMGYGEGLPAPLIYRKGWALLGYLALEPNRMHSRASLPRTCWLGNKYEYKNRGHGVGRGRSQVSGGVVALQHGSR